MSTLINRLGGVGKRGPNYATIDNAALSDGTTGHFSKSGGTFDSDKLFTLALWLKPTRFGGNTLLGALNGSTAFNVFWEPDDTLTILAAGTRKVRTNAVFRDPTAHMHLGMIFDSSNAAQSERFRIYVNGVRTPVQYCTISLNEVGTWAQSAATRYIGRGYGAWFASERDYLDGYFADFIFLDGIAADCTLGGDFLTAAGAPKAYAGSYGTNGFHLKFNNAANLGEDSSGNGNNWTVNGTITQVTDTPTNNVGTWSAVAVRGGSSITNGARTFTGVSSFGPTAVGTFAMPNSGKWYFEVRSDSDVGDLAVGITNRNVPTPINATGSFFLSNGANIRNGSSSLQTGVTSFSSGTVCGIAYNADNAELSFYINGVQSGTTVTGMPSGPFRPYIHDGGSSTTPVATARFNSDEWTYTPPTGFKALTVPELSDVTFITSGSFTGNVSADGPVIDLQGSPETLTINGNAVTFGTHADRLATGFKIRTSSTSYNASGSNTFTATVRREFENTNTDIPLAEVN